MRAGLGLSSSLPRPADRTAAAAAAVVLAIGVFAVSWAALHVGFYDDDEIVDTLIYERYGDRMERGDVPYRDFRVEYPPAALPAFALPSLLARGDGQQAYRDAFELLMFGSGAALIALMAVALQCLDASRAHLHAALAFAALSPLALGSVVLTRFDLLPAAVAVGALAAFVAGRMRLGALALGLGVAVKLWPGVLAPLAFAYVWQRGGRREAVLAASVFAGVVAAIFLPFLVIAPEGFLASFGRQLSRPLQIESLGAALLFLLRNLFDLDLAMKSSHGSQNIAGGAGVAVGIAASAVQAAALVWIWLRFARGAMEPERLVRYAAAAVLAFVVLGKVLSPQFLLWLVPLVPLVAGRRGLAASALLALALVLTQLWFPFRYWDYAKEFDVLSSWLVLARDLVLVGVLGILLARSERFVRRPEPERARN